MDPNKALKKARAALAKVRAWQDEEGETSPEAAEDLVDAFEALDGWLSKGGFLPQAWEGNR